MTDLLRPTLREVAAGIILGRHPGSPAGAGATRAVPGQTPLAALEAAVLPALRRPPCLVSFSGGLDSSLVLAVAVRVARRAGLAEPVPVTWRFAGAPRADESAWQERIIRAVGSQSWQILRADDDLDLVGPVARRMLLAHGRMHPVNLHLHLPIVELAPGGALLTGAGGDQVLDGWRGPAPAWHRALRRAAGRAWRRRPDPFPWLRPEISRQLRRAHRDEVRREPRRLGERIAWHTGRRDLTLARAGLDRIADGQGTVVVNPLLDEGFLAALTADAGHRPDLRRDELLARITRGELPAVITAPRSKARFLEVFLRTPTRLFTSTWDGSGADESLVDVAALRRLWSTWPIPPGTSALVQHLWLATDPADPTLTSKRQS
jgi:asparagine synthase (glutamine-hydrolysing)